MAGATNRGRLRELEWIYRDVVPPTKFFIAFVTDAFVPGPDTKILSDLTEIAAGNGYASGGIELTPGVIDFDTVTEDDTNDLGEVQIRDLPVAAVSGPIPASGGGLAFAVLTDDNVTIGSREVLRFFDIREGGTPRIIADGGSITWQDFALQNKES